METAQLLSLVEHLEDNIDDLDENLEPLLSSVSSGATKKLPLLDRAKFYVLIVYAIESLLFSFLRLNGVNAKEHAIFKELTRVKQYFAKIKAAEEGSEMVPPNMTLDKGAAARFIKHALSGNGRKDLDRAEQQAREKVMANTNSPSQKHQWTAEPKPVIGKRKTKSVDHPEIVETKPAKAKRKLHRDVAEAPPAKMEKQLYQDVDEAEITQAEKKLHEDVVKAEPTEAEEKLQSVIDEETAEPALEAQEPEAESEEESNDGDEGDELRENFNQIPTAVTAAPTTSKGKSGKEKSNPETAKSKGSTKLTRKERRKKDKLKRKVKKRAKKEKDDRAKQKQEEG